MCTELEHDERHLWLSQTGNSRGIEECNKRRRWNFDLMIFLHVESEAWVEQLLKCIWNIFEIVINIMLLIISERLPGTFVYLSF
jgi:hypothetical protein